MPPSTVFSYWRRDHRRSTAPPISAPASSPGPKGAIDGPLSTPPQLPQIPDTPILTTSFDEQFSHDAPPWTDSALESDASKLINSSVAPLSSCVSLAVSSPLQEKEKENQNRPYSSPGDYEAMPEPEPEPEPVFTTQHNNSQLSVGGLRPEGDGESNSKPTSPFRLSFGGKGLRNLQTSAGESQKRSPTAAPGTSHLRIRPSPEESPADKPFVPPRDIRSESSVARRAGERDVSVDNSHHKSGKTMLHLLNPMSLLARRRSSQMGNHRIDEPKNKSSNIIPAIPDDYDPRIRGNIVHDFSAPRPRRNVSGTLSGPPDGGQDASPSQPTVQSPTSRFSDPAKRHSDHSPVFKEHFEDDQNVLQVENKGYLQSSLLTNPTQPGYEKSLPPFAKNLPSCLPDHSPKGVEHTVSPPFELPAELPGDFPASSPKSSPPPLQQDDDTIPNVPRPPSSGLPRHLRSNASRFSFDMGGVESSTQEKLLEEKHKAKEAARKLEDGYFDDFDEDFDQDMLDDFDGLEEKIPGVNADADDDDYFRAPPAPDIKSWAVPGLSPVVASPIAPAPPELPPAPVPREEPNAAPPAQEFAEEPAGDDTSESQEVQQPAPVGLAPPAADKGKQVLDEEDDDLYFDDGEFGDLDVENQSGGFDESIFDDETSHLYERKRVGGPALPPPPLNAEPNNDVLEREILLEENASQGLKHMPSVASEYQALAIKRGPLGEPIPNMGPARAHGGVLTEQNLEVLHNALAFAANEATAKGNFERTFSTSDRSLAQESISQPSHTGESQPGLVSDDSHLSQLVDMAAYEDSYDDQIFDDDLYYDDPIVAAANAEALECDDEGFYGQEFGFYAQAHGSSEMTNGGYFGPRGVEGISRSFSSRGKFQEPSLTPITERSEWSTRNSVISLKAHGATHSNPSLASPGLAQLVDMGNLDDEMSLSALMKLRRGAWGGSNGSLRSSAGSPPPHNLSSSNRGSFVEASPSDARPSGDDWFESMGYQQDDGHGYTASPLKDAHLGRSADLPSSGHNGPSCAAYGDDIPTTGSQRPNGL
ncbi:hypothetical protein N7532_008116 [Penicillium argentinense]|uniref:Uncharacterized protein n=1 Tax=Penicillium argentinense TaxID=1131581 RepID=A0A9W9K273_9EURO|nr:uncharacterized protein N7532_008116 [Penicillium argentinense]KAJ5089432.1 hypothetical protein N7532_008116 [Penicillium argentinense]